AVAVAVAVEVRSPVRGRGSGDVTGDGRDLADPGGQRGDLADQVVAAVADVKGAVVGDPDTFGVAELGLEGVEVELVAVAVGAGPVAAGHPDVHGVGGGDGGGVKHDVDLADLGVGDVGAEPRVDGGDG